MPRITKKNVDSALYSNLDLYSQAVDLLSLNPEIPPICDFVEHTSFLDQPLYPRQRALLKLFFLEVDNMSDYEKNVINEWAENFSPEGETCGVSPDVWDRVDYLRANGYTHFREIINITGRRGGKGYLGALIAAYLSWKMIKRGSPQAYYGMDADKDLYFFVAATNIEQATSAQFADIANVIVGAECFRQYLDDSGERSVYLRTPADISKLATMESQGMRLQRRTASVRLMPISTSPSGKRGLACYGLAFDEFAHMVKRGPRVGDELYNALTPSLDQFRKDACIYIPTSPYSQIGKAYELYLNALETSTDTVQDEPSYPNMLVVQLPSWAPYQDWDIAERVMVAPHAELPLDKLPPQVFDDEMRLLQLREPDTFAVERLSQWQTTINAYLNPKMVDNIFRPFNDGNTERILTPKDQGQMRYMYRAHIDPSKSEANTAVSIAHAELIDDENGEGWYHVILDWDYVWKPYLFDDHQVDYNQVEKELVARFRHFPTLEAVTYDQYGAFVTIPRMKQELRAIGHHARVWEETATVKSNERMYERFKSALGMGWVHAYKDNFGEHGTCLMEQELKFLQKIGEKVDRQQVGSVTTKDLSDTLVKLVDLLLEDNFRRLETRKRLGDTQLVFTGQGGYHTTKEGDLTARDKLGGSRLTGKSFAQARGANRPLYNGMGARVTQGRGRER